QNGVSSRRIQIDKHATVGHQVEVVEAGHPARPIAPTVIATELDDAVEVVDRVEVDRHGAVGETGVVADQYHAILPAIGLGQPEGHLVARWGRRIRPGGSEGRAWSDHEKKTEEQRNGGELEQD